MSQLRRIVVGYTFSPDGELALRSALALAERSQATLYLLHVETDLTVRPNAFRFELP